MRAVVGWYRAFIGLVSLVAAGTTQPCNDTATFLDEFGAKCSAWVGYNCSDEATLLAWGYTLAGLRSVRIGCPATCSTCAEAAAAAASPTPPLQWVAIPRHGASPPPLREMTLLSRQVPGQARREVVLWGGTTGTAMNGDLYKLQVTSGGADALWQKVPITSRTRPVARTQHASALQGGRYLIVCGGADAGHYLLNDVYRLDLDDAHATWEELSPNGVAPMSRRIGHSAAVVNGTRLLIMGGSDPRQYGQPDLWEFSLEHHHLSAGAAAASGAWRRLSIWTPGSDGPRSCYLPNLVAEPGGLGVLSAFGTNGKSLRGDILPHLDASDTWRFDLEAGHWQLQNVSGKPPRDLWAPLVTSSIVGGRLRVVGGFGWIQDEQKYAVPAQSMYFYDVANSSWTSLARNVSASNCTDDPSFTDDFGGGCAGWTGYDCADRAQAAAWGYASSTVDALLVSCRLSCGLCATSGFQPSPRSDGGIVPLSDTEFLVFGGWGASSMLNDLVSFDTERQTFKSIAAQSTFPAPRQGASLVVLGTQSFLFAGKIDSATSMRDLWSLTADDGWTEILVVGESPARRSYHSCDVSGRKMCCFGGLHADGYLLNDLWCFDVFSHRWSQVATSSAPPPRKGHTLIAASDQRWLVFGGTGTVDVVSDTLWTIDLQNDRQWWRVDCPASGGPSPRKSHGSAQVRIDGRRYIAVMGGENTALEEQVDLWLLEHRDFEPAMKSNQGLCWRHDDKTPLRAQWHLVDNYKTKPPTCADYRCDYYVAGRSQFALAGTLSNVLIVSGGVTDYGTQALTDGLIRIELLQSGSATFAMNVQWVSLQSGFSGARTDAVSAMQASDFLVVGGASRIWEPTPLAVTSNEAFRVPFIPCDPAIGTSVGTCIPCSPGFVYDNATGTCKPCSPGTYSAYAAGSNNQSCVRCPGGYTGAISGASSPLQCSPCPAFTHYEELLGCVPCSGSELCPIATIEPDTHVQNATSVISRQPKILLSREEEMWTAQKTVYLVTTVLLATLVSLFLTNLWLKPHWDHMRRLDVLFASHHEPGFFSSEVGLNQTEKKTAIGGWFSLITIVSGVAYIVVLLIPVVMNNIEEQQSLQPNLVWASLGLQHSAAFFLRVTLDGYRGQCSTDRSGTCPRQLSVTTDSEAFRGLAPRCGATSQLPQKCSIYWACNDCHVSGKVRVVVTFAEATAFTHRITYRVTSESSFGDGTGRDKAAQNSSLEGTIVPRSLTHSFRGLEPTRIDILARPSLYTFQSTAQRLSGYHLEYVSTVLGSEVTAANFNDANGVRLVFDIAEADATLATVRVVHQTVFVFVANSFGAVLGMLGILSWVMSYVDAWWYNSRPFDSLDRVDFLAADWLRTSAPRIFEKLNAKFFTDDAAERSYLAVRARCLHSDIFPVFQRFDQDSKGWLTQEEFAEFMLDLDISLAETDKVKIEEFFKDGKVTFDEFREFYVDHVARTQKQRIQTASVRLEKSPRSQELKKKWQTKARLATHSLSLRSTIDTSQLSGSTPAVTAAQSASTSSAVAREEISISLTPRVPPRVIPGQCRRQVEIVNTATHIDDSGKSFTVYEIRCQQADGLEYPLSLKRFSDFWELREAMILTARPGVAEIPFPKRKVLRTKSIADTTVAKRRTRLQEWLNEVITTCACDPDLNAFLQEDESAASRPEIQC